MGICSGDDDTCDRCLEELGDNRVLIWDESDTLLEVHEECVRETDNRAV